MAFWGPILAATLGGLLSKVAILCTERPPGYCNPQSVEPTDEQIAYAQAMKELDAIDAIYLGES